MLHLAVENLAFVEEAVDDCGIVDRYTTQNARSNTCIAQVCTFESGSFDDDQPRQPAFVVLIESAIVLGAGHGLYDLFLVDFRYCICK